MARLRYKIRFKYNSNWIDYSTYMDYNQLRTKKQRCYSKLNSIIQINAIVSKLNLAYLNITIVEKVSMIDAADIAFMNSI